jgi:hypothetical protein
MQWYDIVLLSVGLSPFIILSLVALGVGIVVVLSRFDQAAENKTIGLTVLGIGAAVYVISVILCFFCTRVTAVERFDGAAASAADASGILVEIEQAESDVCKLVTRVDGFIQSDVGKPGADNPALVTEAQESARVGLALVPCSATVSVEASEDATKTEAANDINHRLTLLETTLASFTGPRLKTAYDKTVPCGPAAQEGFVDLAMTPSPESRLAAIRTAIADQKKRYLGPIDDKTAALQRGDVSDCDKQRGATTAVAKTT